MEQVLLSTCDVLIVAVSHFLRSEPENRYEHWCRVKTCVGLIKEADWGFIIYLLVLSLAPDKQNIILNYLQFHSDSPIQMFYLPLFLFQK